MQKIKYAPYVLLIQFVIMVFTYFIGTILTISYGHADGYRAAITIMSSIIFTLTVGSCLLFCG